MSINLLSSSIEYIRVTFLDSDSIRDLGKIQIKHVKIFQNTTNFPTIAHLLVASYWEVRSRNRYEIRSINELILHMIFREV